MVILSQKYVLNVVNKVMFLTFTARTKISFIVESTGWKINKLAPGK